ncbi:Scr1 family TA system antitoxin-like transcriptional regulator [Streptomyces sp. NPDC048479]|uniref:Scr1 family TA system antitoxin-like transcriptional regulator n=1 Tax=Streptomyces sp. NPDC048479 TaxID=3154725 RepID=UPI0034441384
MPHATAEQINTRLQVRLRRQNRLSEPGRPLRLWAVLDELTLWRVVGSREVMREQLEYLVHISEQPHIILQLLPCEVGAH